jgi:hypothetical protein
MTARKRAVPPRRHVPARAGTWRPSRKWWAATGVAAGTLGTAWATAGHWSSTLTIMAIGLAVAQFTHWMLPNQTGDE